MIEWNESPVLWLQDLQTSYDKTLIMSFGKNDSFDKGDTSLLEQSTYQVDKEYTHSEKVTLKSLMNQFSNEPLFDYMLLLNSNQGNACFVQKKTKKGLPLDKIELQKQFASKQAKPYQSLFEKSGQEHSQVKLTKITSILKMIQNSPKIFRTGKTLNDFLKNRQVQSRYCSKLQNSSFLELQSNVQNKKNNQIYKPIHGLNFKSSRNNQLINHFQYPNRKILKIKSHQAKKFINKQNQPEIKPKLQFSNKLKKKPLSCKKVRQKADQMFQFCQRPIEFQRE